jgi:hypothetical protein
MLVGFEFTVGRNHLLVGDLKWELVLGSEGGGRTIFFRRVL